MTCLGCDSSCATCYGPLNTNCLSCHELYTINIATNSCEIDCSLLVGGKNRV